MTYAMPQLSLMLGAQNLQKSQFDSLGVCFVFGLLAGHSNPFGDSHFFGRCRVSTNAGSSNYKQICCAILL